jgi:hypothetical protein
LEVNIFTVGILEVDISTVGILEVGILIVGILEVGILTAGILKVDILTVGILKVGNKMSHPKLNSKELFPHLSGHRKRKPSEIGLKKEF